MFPITIDLSLDRLERLLAVLGDPQDRLPPVVHVAGTNGKGSTVAFTTAMLAAAGHKVHRFTSPHLVRFNERIQLAGRDIDDERLLHHLRTVEETNDGAPITFFEATTCAALLAFSETPADFLVLETGLGGRLDTSNVVARPRVTAITPVAMDHQGFLGDTLAAIATEKAGILKPGVPVVVAQQEAEAAAVIEARAADLGCQVVLQNRDWRVTPTPGGVRYDGLSESVDLPPPGLLGMHQVTNAGVALAIMDVLGPGIADRDARAAGLSNVVWPGRLQMLRHGPLVDAVPEGWEVWLDGGHNPAAGAALAGTLGAWRAAGDAVHLVFGVLATKDAEGFLAPLVPHVDSLTAVTAPGTALAAGDAAAAARNAGIGAVSEATGLMAAIETIRRTNGAENRGRTRILICGSLYLAGQVLAGNG